MKSDPLKEAFFRWRHRLRQHNPHVTDGEVWHVMAKIEKAANEWYAEQLRLLDEENREPWQRGGEE